jgi:membrane protein implicated in regulation of membrane protease activity
MLDRRKKSKILPILFLFLQITAFLLASYFLYLLLIAMGVSATLVLMIILMMNIFVIIKFFTRYFEIKNRTKYRDYEYFGKKGK